MLDLRKSEDGEKLLAATRSMFDLTTETFDLSADELARYAYHPPQSLTSYKKPGLLKTEDGRLDTTDLYTIDRDDLRGLSRPSQHPGPIEKQRDKCRKFCELADSIIAVILSALDNQLGLPTDTLVNLSSPTRPSASALRLLLTRAQMPAERRVTLGAHTDIGLITLLFHVAGGLQILPADTENKDENWRFVLPEYGCVLMNLGDTFVEWTGGLVRSGLHRVVTAPGEQSRADRISIAYPVRPARSELIRRLRGDSKAIPNVDEEEQGSITVDEWASERAAQIIKGVLKPQTFGGSPVGVK